VAQKGAKMLNNTQIIKSSKNMRAEIYRGEADDGVEKREGIALIRIRENMYPHHYLGIISETDLIFLFHHIQIHFLNLFQLLVPWLYEKLVTNSCCRFILSLKTERERD
jgi:hypothetical protein